MSYQSQQEPIERPSLLPDRRKATEAEVKALASEVRIRILRLCLDNPLTNKEIAADLGMNAGTVLHHVRKLVDVGFLTPQEERVGKRGAREIPYLATGVTWNLSYDIDTQGHISKAIRDAFVAESDAKADFAKMFTTRLALRLTDDQMKDLMIRMKEMLEDYMSEENPDPTAKMYSIFIAGHEQ